MAAAMAGFVAMIGLSQGLERAWKNHFEIRGTDLLVFQKGAVEIFTTQIDARYGQTIAEIAGVKEVSGELADILLLEGRITTLAVGWPVESHLWKTVRLLEGRLPTETGEEAVLLGQSAAVALGKKPGDALFIRKRSLPVAGVIRQSGVIGSQSLILPLPTLQAINQHPGKVTVFHVQVQEPRTPEKIAEVRKRLQAALPDLTVMESAAVVENDWVLRLFRAVSWSISVLAVVIALIIMLNTLLMMVMEQTREIGVLGAVGWSEGRVVGYVLLQGLILALGGGICGVLLGGGGLRWLTSFPQVGGLIEGRLSPSLLGEALLAVFLLGGLGSLYPAWRASRLNIVDALRYE
jgi:putative ABC transport system permease protein